MKTVNVVYIALIAATYTEAKIHLVSTGDGKNYLVSRTNKTDYVPYRYPFPMINNDYSLLPGDDEYEYVNPDQEHISHPTGDGDRLVGGRITQSWQYPFVVGWNDQGYTGSSCTGSLITQTYFLSAAHCSGDMTDHDRKNFRKIRNACVEATKSQGSYKHGVKELKCRWLSYKAFEIVASPPGKAWLGRTDVEKDVDQGQMREIKRIIRHRDTYLGGSGYKRRGGYDICMIELQRPFSTKFQPACLPGPDFQDTNRDDNRLAGFGRYHRSNRDKGNICQTNRHGQMKYHYCRSEYGEGSNACVTDEPPPMSAECDKFYASPNTPNSPPENVEEIKLQTRGESVYCYNKKNPQNTAYGWCYTRGNYYEKGSGRTFNGWGFCSDECYQDENEKNTGVLRSKTKVRVLDERQCNDFLKRSFAYGSVDIRPEILCVGYEFDWREENWKLTSSGYRKIKPISKPVRYGSPTYVTSAGTCNGDSGGPVFVKEGNHFVVTGCTSGGRGPLGSCGGINNPVHYARVKKFTTWIVKNMDRAERKNLCWDDAFTQRREARRNKRRG